MRLIRAQHGAAAVEMALLLPLLIVLAFGVIEFSTAYNRVQGLQAATREGARLGVESSVPRPVTALQVRERVWTALQDNSAGSGFPAPGGTASDAEAQIRQDVDVVVTNLTSATDTSSPALNDGAMVCAHNIDRVRVTTRIRSNRQDAYGMTVPLVTNGTVGLGTTAEAVMRCLR